MPNFSILLPPAEGKEPGGNPFAPDMFDYRSSNTFNYFHELNSDRRRLIKALHDYMDAADEEALQKLFGVKGDTLKEAVEINRAIFKAPLMSALDRYSPGVMYQAMDFTGLPTGAQRRMLEHSIILSGLFGLLRPDDLIPNYRLKMDASLPDVGRVCTYWKPLMSPLLNEHLKGRFVWNLLPGVHKDAWDDDHSYERMVEVKFYVEKGGERKAVSHGVKPLRGQLVNFIVRESVEDLEPLLEWEHPEGYRYDEEASTMNDETRTGTVVMVKKG